jgi:hypothetical protein
MTLLDGAYAPARHGQFISNDIVLAGYSNDQALPVVRMSTTNPIIPLNKEAENIPILA